jgi:hypothetical protein
MKVRDLGFVALCLAFLWGCFTFTLFKWGPKPVDVERELRDRGCVATYIPASPGGRAYNKYRCPNPMDNVDIYIMLKGLGEK